MMGCYMIREPLPSSIVVAVAVQAIVERPATSVGAPSRAFRASKTTVTMAIKEAEHVPNTNEAKAKEKVNISRIVAPPKHSVFVVGAAENPLQVPSHFSAKQADRCLHLELRSAKAN